MWERACSRWRWFSHMDVGLTGLIVSKPVPTKELRVHTNIVSAEDPMWERACSRWQWFSHMDVGPVGLIASKPAPTGETRSHQEPGRLLGRLVVDVDLGAPLTTMAERRHCGVGIPAWMPG